MQYNFFTTANDTHQGWVPSCPVSRVFPCILNDIKNLIKTLIHLTLNSKTNNQKACIFCGYAICRKVSKGAELVRKQKSNLKSLTTKTHITMHIYKNLNIYKKFINIIGFCFSFQLDCKISFEIETLIK
jgi:hypothetical protein